MKKISLFFILLIFINCGRNLPSPEDKYPFERKVLIEVFTSISCVYCPVAESVVSLLKVGFKDSICVIKYHIGSGDPFSSNETNERGNFYGVSALPTIFIDGIHRFTGVSGDIYKNYKDKILDRLNIKSSFLLDVQSSIINNKVEYDLSIFPSGIDTINDLLLLVILKEDSIFFNAPNGETLHNFISRKVFKQDIGTILDTLEFSGEFIIDTLWNKKRLSVACFLQDVSKKEILQSVECSVKEEKFFDISIITQDTIISGKVGKISVFPFSIINNGNVSDTITIDFPDSLSSPQDLFRSLCDSTLCYPLPYITYIQPFDTITFELHLTPQTLGTNFTTLLILPNNFPQNKKKLRFYVEATK